MTVAKAYRLLHGMLATAADDKLIGRNPCRDQRGGGGALTGASGVVAAVVPAALDCVQPRYRAVLLLATFASLRFGELAALRRCDLDLDGCVVRVVRSTAQMNDGRLFEQEPKSRAGRRTVSFPQEIGGELRWHLECFALPGAEGLVFVGPLGVSGCEDQTSAICGSLPLRTRACPICTFTIFAIPATRWRLLPALACAS